MSEEAREPEGQNVGESRNEPEEGEVLHVLKTNDGEVEVRGSSQKPTKSSLWHLYKDGHLLGKIHANSFLRACIAEDGAFWFHKPAALHETQIRRDFQLNLPETIELAEAVGIRPAKAATPEQLKMLEVGYLTRKLIRERVQLRSQEHELTHPARSSTYRRRIQRIAELEARLAARGLNEEGVALFIRFSVAAQNAQEEGPYVYTHVPTIRENYQRVRAILS